MKILALCGSLRAASTNRALLEACAQVAGQMNIEIAEIGELPLFNPDLDRSELQATVPLPVRALRERVEGADALLIASPEYAHGVSGVLKNALDWLVSFPPFVDKSVAVFNASPRSLHADAALREILATMSARIVADACLALPLRGTAVTAASIAAAHAAPIRAALEILSGEVRTW
jgi:chromate reductase, NAD(P)H dehydrogenase (quinone)